METIVLLKEEALDSVNSGIHFAKIADRSTAFAKFGGGIGVMHTISEGIGVLHLDCIEQSDVGDAPVNDKLIPGSGVIDLYFGSTESIDVVVKHLLALKDTLNAEKTEE